MSLKTKNIYGKEVCITICILQFILASMFFSIKPVHSQVLNENCTISVLNRTANVQPDGSWTLPNTPSNMGQVRARATCVDTENGVTISGQSDYFTVVVNGITDAGEIKFGNDYAQVPVSLNITSDKLILNSVGDTVQLSITATYPDSSTADITAGSTGTSYIISNPAIATISADGIVTAVSSGTVIVAASNEMVLSSITISVQLSGDSDGDGLPDDFELANGLDPSNPIDAMEDIDRDGLTNLEEFNLGTGVNNTDTDGDGISDGEEVVAGEDGFVINPLLGDSDGDGIWDGLEISSGTDPTDSNSFDIAATLDYIEVTPSNMEMVYNTIKSESSWQLTVTGILIDGNSIDLTSTSMGTNYTSSDLAVASFGSTEGLVFAGQEGTAIITVTNNGISDTTTVNVVTFSPTALSYVELPSFAYANNVDITDSYAYVAAGAGGLFIVDITNPELPFVVTSLDTPGTSIDIKVLDNKAYVADGESGLRVIDISTPGIPFELGFVGTPGIAQDLIVKDNLAFVADGESGLQIVDITDSANPNIIGSVDTPGMAQGVGVEGNIAAVADGNSVQIIDITDPTNPAIAGSVPVTGTVLDLVVRDSYAYLATYTGGFQVVDFSVPSNPSIARNTPPTREIWPNDVALSDQFALFSERIFSDGAIGIYSIVDPVPANYIYTDIITPLDSYRGTGIALTQEFVYVTSSISGSSKYGSIGDTRLYIGQYRMLQDFGTVAPSVSITSPLDGDVVMEGSIIHMTADAADDVIVATVNFIVDGTIVFTDTASPYQFDYTVPMGKNRLTLNVTAVDLANNSVITEDVVLDVIPDPLTTLIGTVVGTDSNPIEGISISTINGLSTTTASNGTFSITDAQTALGDIPVTVSVDINGTLYKSSILYVTPEPGGTTYVDIVERNTIIIAEDTTITADNHDLQFKDISVEGSTLTVDGAHTFNSMVLANAKLTHSSATATEEYSFDVTIANTLNIDSASSIDVSGKGYLGASSGGNSGRYGRTLGNTTDGGSYLASGGSYGGMGYKYSTSNEQVNNVYGDYRNPNELGSGGGGSGGYPGGNGGGLVRVTAGSIVLNGTIYADGRPADSGNEGGGSGGGIYVNTGTLSGTGIIRSMGGDSSRGGGGGRIAIYYNDMSGFNKENITTYGRKEGGVTKGGAGTVYLKSSTQTHGDLIVDNDNIINSTPLKAVGKGTITAISSTMLTDANANFPVPDQTTGALGLVGLELDPNKNDADSATFTIIDNTATTITIDNADGDMTTVAAIGDEYIGVYTFDDLSIKRKASLSTDDNIVVMGVIEISGGGELATNRLNLNLAADEIFSDIVITSTEPLYSDEAVVDLVDDILTLTGPLSSNIGTLTLNNSTISTTSIDVDTINLENYSILDHPSVTMAEEYRLDVTANTLTIDETSSIDVSGKGYLGGYSGGNNSRYGRTLGNINDGGSYNGSGASYGGVGFQYVNDQVNNVYGDFKNPNELGSGGGGGGSSYHGGNGGGLVRIMADSIMLNGTIYADGIPSMAGNVGGGSGGGIYINTGTLSGEGFIRSNGGGGVRGGGGGRIAVYYNDISGFDVNHITTYGTNGGSGTVYLKSSTQTHGDLIVDNDNIINITPLRAVGKGTISAISPTVLTDDNATFPVPDQTTGALGLVNLELDPNKNDADSATFTIIDNTATTITIDSADGDMTTVAAIGDEFIGVYTFDNLSIKREAKLSTGDNIVVMGVIEVSDGGELAANKVDLSHAADEIFSDIVITSSEPLFSNAVAVDLVDDVLALTGPLGSNMGSLTLNNSTISTTVIGADTVVLNNNSIITHPNTTTTEEHSLDLTITNVLTIDSGSAIDVSGKGYLGGYSGGNNSSYGRTYGNTTTGGSYYSSGGSYGGLGGENQSHNVNEVYGSFYNPNEPGSGGGGSTVSGNGGDGGNGGGLVRITATEIVLNGYGSIKSNGGDGGYSSSSYWDGGGSGGGIYINVGVIRSDDGTGIVSANGGNYSATSTGAASGGGGGRIAVYYNDISGFDIAKISTYGGANPNNNGGAGTIYLKSSLQTYGDLIVDNNGSATTVYSTPLVSVGTSISTDLTADTLTDNTKAWRVNDLTGIFLNPNINQGTTPATVFKIVSNDTTSIKVDNSLNNLTDVASIDHTYIGEYYIDNLSVINGARVETQDRIIFNSLNIIGGALQADGFYQIGKSETHPIEKLAKHQRDNMQRVKDWRGVKGSSHGVAAHIEVDKSLHVLNKRQNTDVAVKGGQVVKAINELQTNLSPASGKFKRRDVKEEIKNINKEFKAPKAKFLIPDQKHDAEVKPKELSKYKALDESMDVTKINFVVRKASG